MDIHALARQHGQARFDILARIPNAPLADRFYAMKTFLKNHPAHRAILQGTPINEHTGRKWLDELDTLDRHFRACYEPDLEKP